MNTRNLRYHLKPVEPYQQKKSDASYLNSTPTRTLWFSRDWKRCGEAKS
jgi:hypothetical protein